MISTPRRMFLQTAGATLALPLVGGELVFAQRRRRRDPVLAELLRQTRAAAHQASRYGAVPSGESARSLANAFRLLAAHGATIGLDTATENALREAVRREGRQAVLARRPDASALAATLDLEVDINRLGVAPDNPAARAAALDALLKPGGVSSAWLVMAQSLEQIGAELDRGRGIQLIRQQAPDCTGAQFMLFILEVQMIAACGPWAIAIPEYCAIMSAGYLAWRFYMWTIGC